MFSLNCLFKLTKMIQRSVVIRHFQDQMLTLNQSEENHARTYGIVFEEKGKKNGKKGRLNNFGAPNVNFRKISVGKTI